MFSYKPLLLIVNSQLHVIATDRQWSVASHCSWSPIVSCKSLLLIVNGQLQGIATDRQWSVARHCYWSSIVSSSCNWVCEKEIIVSIYTFSIHFLRFRLTNLAISSIPSKKHSQRDMYCNFPGQQGTPWNTYFAEHLRWVVQAIATYRQWSVTSYCYWSSMVSYKPLLLIVKVKCKALLLIGQKVKFNTLLLIVNVSYEPLLLDPFDLPWSVACHGYWSGGMRWVGLWLITIEILNGKTF